MFSPVESARMQLAPCSRTLPYNEYERPIHQSVRKAWRTAVTAAPGLTAQGFIAARSVSGAQNSSARPTRRASEGPYESHGPFGHLPGERRCEFWGLRTPAPDQPDAQARVSMNHAAHLDTYRASADASWGRRRHGNRQWVDRDPRWRVGLVRSYSSNLRKRSAFTMTETELKVMARLAIIGLKRIPNQG
jgi:hypothetical protein